MIKSLLTVILILLAFTGCTMAPTYTRPTAPVPGEWPTGPAYQATQGLTGPFAPDIGWRSFYTDEKLRNLIDLALKNNRDLRIAALNIEKARAIYRIQRSYLVPSVSAVGDWTDQRLPADLSSTGSPMVYRQYSVGVSVLSYELDLFGRVRSLKDQALEQYFATEEARRSVQIMLVADVAYAYLLYAADSEKLKVSRDTLESQEASYKLIEHRLKVGTASELDLRQAQTRVDAARVDIAFYIQLVAQDENALALLLGAPVPPELLTNQLGTVQMFKDITTGASSEILLKRPDILQAEHLLKAANANIGAARAAFFPSILLTTGTGTMSAQLSNLFLPGQDTWNFLPQVTLPIFDAGLRSANLDQAWADRNINVARYEKAIQIAFREVADALAVRGTIGDQMKAQESLVEASEETYRLADARYTKGIDNYLAALDAQRSLYAARQRLITIRLSQLGNLVTLYKVTGGGDGE